MARPLPARCRWEVSHPPGGSSSGLIAPRPVEGARHAACVQPRLRLAHHAADLPDLSLRGVDVTEPARAVELRLDAPLFLSGVGESRVHCLAHLNGSRAAWVVLRRAGAGLEPVSRLARLPTQGAQFGPGRLPLLLPRRRSVQPRPVGAECLLAARQWPGSARHAWSHPGWQLRPLLRLARGNRPLTGRHPKEAGEEREQGQGTAT
jgi:hypothetical protein